MNHAEITPVVLTFNEQDNIARCLASLHWAERIVVLDSGSSDDTEWICRSNPRVDFHKRAFDRHADQWNAALAHVESPWVLSLDADYIVTDDWVKEANAMPFEKADSGFRIPLAYCVLGQRLRASLLPPRICLFRKDRGHYVQDGHTQDLVLEGTCGTFCAPILHDDHKPFSRWWRNQQKYAALEAEKLEGISWRKLSPQDRLRKLTPLAPLAVAVFCLLGKGLLFEVPHGWIYTSQRVLAEVLLLRERIRTILF
jgi:glycosyltransferase involved in cell wall biosynthesis